MVKLHKEQLEKLMLSVDKIVEGRNSQVTNLFKSDTLLEELFPSKALPLQNAELSYSLYYENIQKFIGSFLPKDKSVSKPIRNLIGTLLSHHEMKYIKYGKRGGDSRMASTEDMENIIDVLAKWSETPNDFFRLANILIEKNKELKFIPEERTIKDYV
ncbi:MAG: hypothetical protein ACTTI1_03550 [Prevotella intermedia]